MDPFEHALADALANHHDLAALGASPLAAPYFLGNALTGDDALARGATLKSLLRKHHQQLDPLLQDALDTFYWQRTTQPASPKSRGKKRVATQSIRAISHLKGPSDRSLKRYRNEALRALGQALLHDLRPSLRADAPAGREAIGRSHAARACLAHLRKGECVALTGPGGIGKTTLGATVAAQWRQRFQSSEEAGSDGVFWYSLRPGLNDTFESLAFALGYFMRLAGQHRVWQQLVADPARVRYEVWKGLLNSSLLDMRANPPLIVIDELDLLDRDHPVHQELLKAIEGLKGHASLLLIGQQARIAPDYAVTLKGLDAASVASILAASHIHAPAHEVQALTRATHGNPGPVSAFVILCKSGVRVADALKMLEQSPTVDALFDRIWERLRDDERVLLGALTVLDTPAPRDGWPNLRGAMDSLIERMLVMADAQGRVELAAYLRRAARARIDAAAEAQLNAAVAPVFESRGDYVTAMRHFVLGGQTLRAVNIWHTWHKSETESGRGAAALAVLSMIDPEALREADRTLLHLHRGKLLNMRGQPIAAEQSLRLAERRARMPMLALIKHYLGEALEAQRDRYEDATRAYEEEGELLADLPDLRRVMLHAELSNLYRNRLAEFRKAREQAQLSKLIADTFLGAVEQQAGNMREAQRHFASAIELCSHLPGNTRSKSAAYGYAAGLAAMQGQYDEALVLADKSRAILEARGEQVRLLVDAMTLSFIHILRGAPQDALDAVLPALETAQSLGQGYLIGGLSTNAAEALLALDRVDEAEHYARMALGPEETFGVAYGSIPLGLVYLHRGLVKEAITSFELSLQAAREATDAYAELQAWRELARAHAQSANTKKAREAAERWLALARKMEITHEIAQAERVLDNWANEIAAAA
jgi:tetratricopeptide (TPR) repeat protein